MSDRIIIKLNDKAFFNLQVLSPTLAFILVGENVSSGDIFYVMRFIFALCVAFVMSLNSFAIS
jgi:hypothetical protein